MFRLVVVFEDFGVVFEFIDESQLHRVAFGLDDESHLPARVADADVGTPASDPAGGVGGPDPSDKQAPRFRDVHLSAEKIALEIVEHVAPFVKTFKKTM